MWIICVHPGTGLDFSLFCPPTAYTLREWVVGRWYQWNLDLEFWDDLRVLLPAKQCASTYLFVYLFVFCFFLVIWSHCTSLLLFGVFIVWVACLQTLQCDNELYHTSLCSFVLHNVNPHVGLGRDGYVSKFNWWDWTESFFFFNRRIGIEKARELLVEKISNYCSHRRKVYEEGNIGCSESPSAE